MALLESTLPKSPGREGWGRERVLWPVSDAKIPIPVMTCIVHACLNGLFRVRQIPRLSTFVMPHGTEAHSWSEPRVKPLAVLALLLETSHLLWEV